MKKIYILLILIMFFTGCASVEKQIETNENKLINDSVLKIMINYKGEKWMELSSKMIFPGVIIGAYSVDETGDIIFDINKFKFFTNWSNGWTEGEYSAFGKIVFHKVENGYKCKIIDKFELGDIELGRVRYFDAFVSDDRGLQSVRNRLDRIIDINSFLRTKGLKEYYEHAWFDKNKEKTSFKTDTMKILFPELVPTSVLYGKDVTSDYKVKNIVKDTNLSETVLWNKLYTEKAIPENLQDIRNSGTMYRDYEESLWLFFMDYNMKYYFEKVLENDIFKLKL
jgi:hypothetical protein